MSKKDFKVGDWIIDDDDKISIIGDKDALIIANKYSSFLKKASKSDIRRVLNRINKDIKNKLKLKKLLTDKLKEE